MYLFKLVGSIFVDTDAANDSLSKTDKKAEGVGDTFSKVAGGVAKAGAVIGTAAIGVGSAAIKMASDSSASMDVIDKGSQRMKISAESYQELAHAASLSGVEMGTLEKAAKKLEGTGMSLDDALGKIYEYQTAEERAAAAAELFGDSVAYSMTPMLNASGEEMAAMRQEANDLGLVMSGDMVAAGASLNDSLSNLQDSVGAMATRLGGELMPFVQQGVDLLLSFMPTFQTLFDAIAPVLLSTFETLMPVITELVQSLLPVIVELINTLAPVFTQLVQAVMPIFVTLLSAISPILTPIVQLLSPLLSLLMELLTPLLDLINLILPPIIDLATVILTTVVNGIQEKVTSVLNFFQKLKSGIKTIFEQIVEFVKKPVNSVIGFINGLISGIVGGINGVIRALNRFQINVPDWVTKLTGVKSFGFNLGELSAPQIPLLAQGADVEGQGSAIVGERGAELVELPRGARVTPLGDDAKLADKLDEMIKLLKQFVNMGVYIDGTALVGKLGGDIDRELGRIANRATRWA